MKIRKTINEKVGKLPYVGKALTSEIGMKEIGVTAIGAYMTLVSAMPALAADGSVEVISGVDGDNYASTTIDAKLSGEIAARTNFFLRNRISIDHESQTDSFTLIDLTYALGKGFDAVQETQFTAGAEMDPRLGIQYFRDIGRGFTAYALITRNFDENPNTELTTILGYEHDLKGNWKLMGKWEQIVNISDEVYNYDTARLRLGISKGKFTIGPAADISGIGSKEEPSYNVGGFVAVKF